MDMVTSASDSIITWLTHPITSVHFALIGVYLLMIAALSIYVRQDPTAPRRYTPYRALYWIVQFIISVIVLVASQLVVSTSLSSTTTSSTFALASTNNGMVDDDDINSNNYTTVDAVWSFATWSIMWRMLSIIQVYFDLALNGKTSGTSIIKKVSHMLSTSFLAYHQIELGTFTTLIGHLVYVLTAVDGLVGKRPGVGYRGVVPIADILTLKDTTQTSKELLTLIRLTRSFDWRGRALPLTVHAISMLCLSVYRSYLAGPIEKFLRQRRVRQVMAKLKDGDDADDDDSNEPIMEFPELPMPTLPLPKTITTAAATTNSTTPLVSNISTAFFRDSSLLSSENNYNLNQRSNHIVVNDKEEGEERTALRVSAQPTKYQLPTGTGSFIQFPSPMTIVNPSVSVGDTNPRTDRQTKQNHDEINTSMHSSLPVSSSTLEPNHSSMGLHADSIISSNHNLSTIEEYVDNNILTESSESISQSGNVDSMSKNHEIIPSSTTTDASEPAIPTHANNSQLSDKDDIDQESVLIAPAAARSTRRRAPPRRRDTIYPIMDEETRSTETKYIPPPMSTTPKKSSSSTFATNERWESIAPPIW